MITCPPESKFDFEVLCRKLRDKEQFSFSRFGDGEIECLLGYSGYNCDGHDYYKDLGDILRIIIQKKTAYYVGLQSLALKLHGARIFDVLFCAGKSFDDFCDADILHNASIADKLHIFFESLRGKQVLMVGPQWYLMPNSCIDAEVIVVPQINAWLEYEYIKDGLLSRNLPDVVLFGCGMMAKVLIDDLHFRKKNRSTLIDVGSLLDPYYGICTRKYHKAVLARIRGKT